MFNSNASYEATIAWNQLSGENPTLHFDTVKPSEFNFSHSVSIETSNKAKSMNTHFARLTNLKPDQKYYFSIKDSEGYSIIYHFSTVPDVPTERLSFIAGGDSRDLSETRRKGNKMVPNSSRTQFFSMEISPVWTLQNNGLSGLMIGNIQLPRMEELRLWL